MAGRRERILKEGFRLFSENNIDKVPMNDVADAAGVGIATLYRYYLTKSELVLAISTDIWTKYVNVDYKKLENDIKADMTAGFSLGELSALTYAGVMDLETGLNAVRNRAELMQQAALDHDTSMAAVIKLTNEKIEELCAGFEHVYSVNFNCPGQTSVSGDAQEMLAFAEKVKEAGGRAKVLKVNGAFHSPYMSKAAEGFREVLSVLPAFHGPSVTVYSNYTGLPYTTDVIQTLTSQIDNPVKWEMIVRHMIADGADTFVELGPGKTLTGLIKRIDPDVRLFNVSVPEDLDLLIQSL